MKKKTSKIREDLKPFAERLRMARLTSGYPRQEDFARALGLKTPTYAHYERPRNEPPQDTLVKVAKLTGFSIHWLVTGEGPPRAAPPKKTAGPRSRG